MTTNTKVLTNNQKILVSFSGGRTSAFLARYMQLSTQYEGRLVYVFANTGKEREETLQFIEECDKAWGLGVVWVEAVVHEEKGKGTTHRVVNFETASRDGEPFREMITKYGLPTQHFPHCTRELKQRPIHHYMKSIHGIDYLTATGIRSDEKGRKSKDLKIIHPLIELNITERFIRDWWENQDFDLKLKDYEGNCDLCWKKSLRKRMTLIEENPSIADWWEKEESRSPYTFDRDNLTIQQIRERASTSFRRARDKHELTQAQCTLFDLSMDKELNCFCQST